MAVNTELADKVLAKIKEAPLHWDQSVWMRLLTDEELGKRSQGDQCGSAFCVAGWACALSGWKPRRVKDWYGNPVLSEYVYFKNGRKDIASDRGQKLLGINDEDAAVLFSAGNQLEDIERHVADLKAGRPLRSRYEYQLDQERQTA